MNKKTIQTIVRQSKGIYVLMLQLAEEKTLRIGRLGKFEFPPGFCCYVGSALGPGGLGSRVGWHLAGNGSPRWHVDYLRRAARPCQLWFIRGEREMECPLAKELGKVPEATSPVNKFGSTDCDCPTHLFYFSHMPSFNKFSDSFKRYQWPVVELEKLDLL